MSGRTFQAGWMDLADELRDELRVVRDENERLRDTLEQIVQIAQRPAKPQNALDGIASIASSVLRSSDAG